MGVGAVGRCCASGTAVAIRREVPRVLAEQLGLEHGDVQQVLLAGSFGSYLSPASAVRIGLVPTLPVLRIVAAGNVAGEGVHAFVADLDRAWTLAPSVHGPRQRWSTACAQVARDWPVLGGPRRWRLGELTVGWEAVAPNG